MGNVYKPWKDSYTEKNVDPEKAVGIWGHRYVAKHGLRTHNPEHLMGFYYNCYMAKLAGYDYVVLSGKRTNSGRDEAIRITSTCANKGKKLFDANYLLTARKGYDNDAKICKGDIFVPDEGSPRYYDDLPEHPEPKLSNSDSNTDQHEDELMALIECMTGDGNKAKAFRSIARFLIKEAIDLEQQEKEIKDGSISN